MIFGLGLSRTYTVREGGGGHICVQSAVPSFSRQIRNGTSEYKFVNATDGDRLHNCFEESYPNIPSIIFSIVCKTSFFLL